jgi:nucleoside 2-deoxyribosyltransferase
MNIYISGAITNDPNFREKFRAAEIDIRDAGHVPFNPAEFNADRNDGLNRNQQMGNCFKLMDLCEAMYQLPDWENSKGALVEYGYALAKGMSIFDATTMMPIDR